MAGCTSSNTSIKIALINSSKELSYIKKKKYYFLYKESKKFVINIIISVYIPYEQGQVLSIRLLLSLK